MIISADNEKKEISERFQTLQLIQFEVSSMIISVENEKKEIYERLQTRLQRLKRFNYYNSKSQALRRHLAKRNS
jgi:hypothetical protein